MIYSIGRLTRYFGALLALGMLLFSSPAVAREYETHIEVETAEDVYSLLRAGIIDDQTAALLEIYLQDPIPINQANAEMLYDLPGLTWALAQAVVADRVQNGPFNTAGDLLRVSGMDPNLVKSISPFVTLIKPGLRGRKGKDGISGHTRFGTIWKDGVGKSQSVVDPILDKNIGPQGLLQLRADGFGQYGVGALVTYRRQTDAWWDYARGALVTTGPENQATLDHVYGWGSIGNAKVIVGSYDVGFGERLVFDTSSHRNPDGLYLNTRYTVDNDAGVIRPDTSLFGIAATIEDVPVGPGQVDATFFSSYQDLDIYQYEYIHGDDGIYNLGACSTAGDCPDGYSCGTDNLCHSSAIYDSANPLETYRYERFKDALSESLAGVSVKYKDGNKWQAGITGYYAQITPNLAIDSEPRPALHSRYPSLGCGGQPDYDGIGFGAIGVHGRTNQSWGQVSSEYAHTRCGGNGLVLRGIFQPMEGAEVTAALRYYDENYENPYGRGEAAADEALGSRQRNERGFRVQAILKPITDLRLVTSINLWENPMYITGMEEGGIEWKKWNTPLRDAIIGQRASYKLNKKERLMALYEYRNKDLANGGRDENYNAGEMDCTDTTSSSCGQGERHKVEMAISSERLKMARIFLSYTAAWEDVTRYDDRFDFEQILRLRAGAAAWDGARVIASAAYWFHSKERDPSSTIAFSDRERPMVDTYLEVKQRLMGTFSISGRYTYLYFVDESDDRYSSYQIGRLLLEAKF